MSPVSQSVQTHLPCHCSCQRKSQIPAPFSNVIKVKLLSLLLLSIHCRCWLLLSSCQVGSWYHLYEYGAIRSLCCCYTFQVHGHHSLLSLAGQVGVLLLSQSGSWLLVWCYTEQVSRFFMNHEVSHIMNNLFIMLRGVKCTYSDVGVLLGWRLPEQPLLSAGENVGVSPLQRTLYLFYKTCHIIIYILNIHKTF